MNKRVYSKPMTLVVPLQCENVCLVNSGVTGGVVPGMPWEGNGGTTQGTMPGLSREYETGGTSATVPGMGWEEYENP